MPRFILIRPGQTDYDEQRRIKGCLSIPLNRAGANEVAVTVNALRDFAISCVYCSPCRAAVQTAQAVGDAHEISVVTLAGLQNLDRGLWQGKLIREIKRQQPKAFRCWQDKPRTMCPSEGELVLAAESRVADVLAKLRRRHKTGDVAVVIPEPLATIVACMLNDMQLGNLWAVECASGSWEAIDGELEHAAIR